MCGGGGERRFLTFWLDRVRATRVNLSLGNDGPYSGGPLRSAARKTGGLTGTKPETGVKPMRADVKSGFDVAFWFADTALEQNEYLQPQKLQRLLFLAQGYYAVLQNGRKLMPAVFVADELGPLEPNIYAGFSRGRPNIDVELFISHDIDSYLTSLWRRFGHASMERLNQITKGTSAYKQARAKGQRTEITLDAMRLSFVRAENTPGVQQVVKPKVFVTQTGKPVQVKAWDPGSKNS